MAMKDSREQSWPLSIQDVLNLLTEFYSSKFKEKFYSSLLICYKLISVSYNQTALT